MHVKLLYRANEKVSHKRKCPGIYISMRKKIFWISIIVAVFLIWLDETVKTLILHYDGQRINHCNGSDCLIHYHPVLNEAGSFLNQKLDMQYNYPVFMGIGVLGIIFSVYLFWQFWEARKKYNCSSMVFVPGTVFLAACVGRVIERLIWDYTLDFIAVKNAGVIDLIDVYLWVGGFGLLMANLYIQILERRAKRCSC